MVWEAGKLLSKVFVLPGGVKNWGKHVHTYIPHASDTF